MNQVYEATEKGVSQVEISTVALSASQLCYKCGQTVMEGTAFCEDCRGTELFQKISQTRQSVEQRQEKVKLLRTSMSKAARGAAVKTQCTRVVASLGALLVVMAFIGVLGYFLIIPH